MGGKSRILFAFAPLVIVICVVLLVGRLRDTSSLSDGTVPREERWGIYALDLATENVELVYSSSKRISYVRLSSAGDRFVFSQKIGGDSDEHEEICTVGVDGSGFTRLTNNSFSDLYPSWSSDDSRIAFLSWRDADLDIYVIDIGGGNVRRLYDSGSHDADVHWVGDRIVSLRTVGYGA